MSEPAVRVEDLRKTYGDRDVVDGLTFHIDAGETFALLGPNGAGKSTTVEILEGYRHRSGGVATVLGDDPAAAHRAWKSRIGVVLQTAGQAGNATVREQVAQFAAYYPHPRNVDEVIAAVGLSAQAKTRISRLSGGQQRRVDVALGVVGRPDVLFLDEPTTGFDPEARREFWDLIRALKADGTTIVLTTHYLDEAANLANRVGVIAAGRMRAIGSVDGIGDARMRTPIVRWREAGEVREERTDAPLAFARSLGDRLGGEPEDLEIVRPSLEDVYLDLVAAAPADTPTA